MMPAMSVATVTVRVEPDRHALVMPDCQCGTCPPTWARRRGKSRRFSHPVTLVEALEREDAAARLGMVGRHRERLEELTAAVDRVISQTVRDDPDRSGGGLALLMFAAELASAVRPDEYRGVLPAELVAACERAVTAATLAAAACLSGFVETMQVLSALVG
jgi:hypothetical protein